MTFLEKNFLDLRNLDTMARGETWVHRLDPRAKLITTLLFLLAVVSVDKYGVAQLLPFLLYPVALIAIGGLPPRYFLRKIAVVAPFAVLLGIFNPLLDRGVVLHLGPIAISGGWLSFTSLLIRFSLTVGTALVLIGMTSFNGLCLALERLRVPRLFVTQLLFLYRYLFVLVDEAHRMTRARELRTFAHHHPDLKIFGSMIGHLLLKAADRAERIHLAMRCRGFDGHFRMLTAPAFGIKDLLFVLGWSFFFLFCRLYNVPELLGGVALEVVG